MTLLLLVASLVVPAAPASAAGFTETELVIEGVPGPAPATGNRVCTGTGGACLLSATLFVPDPLPVDPVPALLMPQGFGSSRGADYVREAAELFASEGYVVLSWDSRGFGTSQGYVMLDHPDYEGADVSELIDHLLTVPQVQLDGPGDPRVGMYGQSYGGGVQFLAAAQDDRIDALVARETWHDLRHALFPNGILKYQFVSLLFASGQHGSSGNMSPELSEWYTEAVATNTAPPGVLEELRIRSHVAYPGQVKVPTFIAQGERDTLFTLIESQRNLDMITANGVPTKLVWYWGGHGGYPMYPEGSKTWTTDDMMESRQLAWLDRYLRGNEAADTGPRFEYFDEAGVLRSADALPPIADVPVALGAGGESFMKPPGRECPPQGAPTCSYTETSNFSAPGQPFAGVQPYDPPGAFVALDTGPLDEPLPVLGVPKASFTVSTATGQPVSVFFKVFDVAPDGTATLINRLVTPIRATPGQAYTLDMAGFSHTFAAGHRFRLVVASTDAAYFGTDLADQVTLSGPVSMSIPVADAGSAAPLPALPSRLPDAGPELPATGGGAVAAGIALVALALVGSRRR